MSGSRILGDLLRAQSVLPAGLEAKNIKMGRLPVNAPLPNLLIRRVSWNKAPTLAKEPYRRVTERMQVTAKAADYQSKSDLLDFVVDTCIDQVIASASGVTNIAILSAGGGPDFDDESASIFMGSHDFYVSFNQPA